MAVLISKSSGLNDNLWNEWAPLIRSYIMDADKDKNKYDDLLKSMFNVGKSDKFGEKNTGLTEFADFMITGEGGQAILDDLQETFPKLIEHEELMKKQGRYASLYEIQSQYYRNENEKKEMGQ